MSRKSNHQNLLRTALTTAGTNMTRWAVTLALVMMTTASALADTTYSYITDLMLIGKNNKTEANKLKEQYVAQGWTAIDQDLNAGCGSKSDYIYLLYKVGGLASANQSFITDIYITTDKTSDINATRTIKGREYKLVPYDGDEHFMEKKGDLNSNAGGDDIHLYYTTDNDTDAKAISSIAFNKTQSDAVGKNGDNSTGYDLNTRAGGDDIYMHCTRNGAPQWIIETFPSILGGAQVVASSLNYKDFPELETIYVNDNFNFEVMLPINTEGNELLEHIHVVDEGGKVIRPDELPASVRNIPNDAFYKCTGLTKVTIPGSVTSIGDCAFKECSKLQIIYVNKNNPNYKDIDGVLFDKAGTTILLFPRAYPNKDYVIPDGVTNIGTIFAGRTDLTGITIPGSVESIGYKAFSECKSLESVTIENGVESIGQGAFIGCTGLTSVTIEYGVESIGQGAFLLCGNLASVSIMGNPKMGDGAFPDKATVTLNLTANAANGAKWMTFYNDRYNFQADANTTVYKATVVGQSLVLTEVADKIVNGATRGNNDIITAPATAVILKSTGNPVMTRVTDRSSDTQANALIGTMEATATPANCFTLASGSKGVGFYRYTGSEVAAGKAYLIYSGASAAREFIGFDETTGIYSIPVFDEGGEATGTSTITVPATLEGNGSAWYDLYGRKLQGEPAKKGIYMRNGRKVVIK